jgi:hypothetical protein
VKKSLLFAVFLFLAAAANSTPYYSNYTEAYSACSAVYSGGYTGSNKCYAHSGAPAYVHFCSTEANVGVSDSYCHGSYPERFRAYYISCPVDQPLNGAGDECTDPPPAAEAGDTMTGECHSWQDECFNDDYLDENGTHWSNDGVAICDGSTCLNQWTNTGTDYDLQDPNSWPENTRLSTDDASPTGLGAADELSPFDNYDAGAAGEITTESDSSTTTNSDGSGSTTQTDTRLKNDGTKEETTTTVDTDSSGGTTTTSTTKTTSQDGSTSTSSTTETKDSGGTVTSSSSTDSVDEEGEQEEDPSKVSGGGTCANPPACEGDAILCHIDQLAWERNCGLDDAVNQAETEFQSQGMVDLNTIAPGGLQSELIDGDPTDLSGEAASVFAASSSLNTACPSDFTIDVGIGSVTVPVHILCTYAAIVRTLVMLMASVFASMTLFRYVGAI